MPAEPAVRRSARSVSVIAPTYNERDNLRPLVAALDRALAGLAKAGLEWELIVVDDDSPDRTWEVAQACAREGWPVRCLRRLGRRGLASAVVEGVLASSADLVVVMDADGQHDETAIPALLQALDDGADLAVASRHAPGGGLGEWDAHRRGLSALATRLSTALMRVQVSDPMSGFFAMRRAELLACVYGLSQSGYKILLDILASARPGLRIAEVPYVFRPRARGESKLDTLVGVEFLLLMVDKATGGLLGPRFMMFLAVGCCGLACHLSALRLALAAGQDFVAAQVIATLAAMTLNFAMNNALTYRAERLRGWALARGYLVFCAVCSLGAVAGVSVASAVLNRAAAWPLAGLAGAAMSAVFNFEIASRMVWRVGGKARAAHRRQARATARLSPAPVMGT